MWKFLKYITGYDFFRQNNANYFARASYPHKLAIGGNLQRILNPLLKRKNLLDIPFRKPKQFLLTPEKIIVKSN